jgi:prevent-host-death family protein
MDRVGVRELRQNLSTYLRRAARGERFIVTDRAEEVAVLGPPPKTDDPWERLIAEGKLIPATKSLLDLPPPVPLDDPYAGTKALQEVRGEWPD